jgi:hypothetical protein
MPPFDLSLLGGSSSNFLLQIPEGATAKKIRRQFTSSLHLASMEGVRFGVPGGNGSLCSETLLEKLEGLSAAKGHMESNAAFKGLAAFLRIPVTPEAEFEGDDQQQQQQQLVTITLMFSIPAYGGTPVVQQQQQLQQQLVTTPDARAPFLDRPPTDAGTPGRKRRNRETHDPSLGQPWGALTVELADSHMPRDTNGHFLQRSALHLSAPDLESKLDVIVGAIVSVVISGESAQKLGITATRVRGHIFDHTSAVNKKASKLLAFQVYESYSLGEAN